MREHMRLILASLAVVGWATAPMEREPYDASFSNNGKKLVHDLTDTVTGPPRCTGRCGSMLLSCSVVISMPRAKYGVPAGPGRIPGPQLSA